MFFRTLIVFFSLTGVSLAQYNFSTSVMANVDTTDMISIGDFSIDRYEYPNQFGAMPYVNVTFKEEQK